MNTNLNNKASNRKETLWRVCFDLSNFVGLFILVPSAICFALTLISNDEPFRIEYTTLFFSFKGNLFYDIFDLIGCLLPISIICLIIIWTIYWIIKFVLDRYENLDTKTHKILRILSYILIVLLLVFLFIIRFLYIK